MGNKGRNSPDCSADATIVFRHISEKARALDAQERAVASTAIDNSTLLFPSHVVHRPDGSDIALSALTVGTPASAPDLELRPSVHSDLPSPLRTPCSGGFPSEIRVAVQTVAEQRGGGATRGRQHRR